MRTSFLLTFIFSVTVCYSQISTADKLWLDHMRHNRFDSALFQAEESAAIIRANPGENSIEYAGVLHRLSVSHFYLFNFFKAKYYILEEISLRELLKKTEDAEYISALDAASVICRKAGFYEDGLVQIKKCEKISEKINGPESIDHAFILSDFAAVYNDFGCALNDIVLLRKAAEYYKKAQVIFDKSNGRFRKQEIVFRSDMACFYNNTGNFPLAESILSDILLLCEAEYGKTHPAYANAVNNLAVYYNNNTNHIKAERYFNEAVKIYKSIGDTLSNGYAVCLNNLGALNYGIGNYERAAVLMLESENIIAPESIYQDQKYSILLNNIATNYMMNEYYAAGDRKNSKQLSDCGSMLLTADSLFALNCRTPHPWVSVIVMNTSLWYKMTGNALESLQLMKDDVYQSNFTINVVSMTTKMTLSASVVFDKEQSHLSIPEAIMVPIKATVSDHMIDEKGLENNRENQVASTRLLMRMLIGDGDKIKNALGPYHPCYATLLKSFSSLYESIGDYSSEEELTLKYMNIVSHNILQDFTFLSESEKELFMKTRIPDMDNFMNYALKRKARNPGITGNAYDYIILFKGLMLKSSTAMRLAILNSNDSLLIKSYNEWISIQKKISALYATPVEFRSENVTTLETKATEIEKELVKGSQIFGDFRNEMNIKWTTIRYSLKPGEAAIEFTNFRRREMNAGDSVIYCALVIRKDSKYPEMIRLFEEKELLGILGVKGKDDLSKTQLIYGTKSDPDNRLYNLIWKPLERSLDGIKTIYISPAGLLNKVSFASLSGDKNTFTCDNYMIYLKGSTGRYLKQNTFSDDNKMNALIFGGINYSPDNHDSSGWKYLSGTKTEAEAVKNILENEHIPTVLLTSDMATETSLKHDAGKYSILHVSTHGFFFPDPNDYTQSDEPVTENTTITFRGSMEGLNISNIANNQNPLMRSGLIFAGANDKMWTGAKLNTEDDGVLTAQEVTQIDMRNNNLVVLSACETGLGDIRGSEGVYGLQRAFKMAGVKYIIMSLWQVPDKETVEFMELFYKKLLKEKDVRQAFNETQKEMRKKY
ncbi:MAG: CHAT domain-containing protein, partial [Proteobacteria bacterium]|nr:CHAT domain-containing protein [Pseudomonadota bacterium]